jgi:protein-S-isoprenylcysteine O-methyltransferase Ste14
MQYHSRSLNIFPEGPDGFGPSLFLYTISLFVNDHRLFIIVSTYAPVRDRYIIFLTSYTLRMEKKVVFAFLYILVFPALILLLSGDLTWPEGWIFSIWFILLCYSTILYLYRKDPALLEERYRQPGTGNQQRWDRYVVYGLVAGFITWIVIIPLDAQRFGWSTAFPLWVKILGIAGLAGSFFLFFRSYTDNTFLSPLVRIQEDRKQRVVSTGIYGFVRHPMYLGGIFMFTGAPLLLGSLYGLFVGLVLTALLMARIKGEEAMLARDLEGYREYIQKVRYRLIPCIW